MELIARYSSIGSGDRGVDCFLLGILFFPCLGRISKQSSQVCLLKADGLEAALLSFTLQNSTMASISDRVFNYRSTALRRRTDKNSGN
jgi:hypothetical protein